MSVTIIIPCKEDKDIIDIFIEENKEILAKYPVFVINKKGGELIRPYSTMFWNNDLPFWSARKMAYPYVRTPFVLNLDAATILPKGYVEKAVSLLMSDPTILAVALDYIDLPDHDHYGFGTSVWRARDICRLYDYAPINHPFCECECKHMWKRIEQMRGKLVTVPNMKAIHLQKCGFIRRKVRRR